MAVRNNEVTRLNLKVITGSDENGKDTIATRGFTVNPELDDDTIPFHRQEAGEPPELPRGGHRPSGQRQPRRRTLIPPA